MVSKEERDMRLRERLYELSQARAGFLLKYLPHQDDRITMPNHHDLGLMPEVVTLLEEDEAQIPMTAERLGAISDVVLASAAVHRERVRRDLVKLLGIENTPTSNTGSNGVAPSDDEVLRRAAALFVAPRKDYDGIYTRAKLLSYPEILQWERVASRTWERALKELLVVQPGAREYKGSFPRVYDIATQVLKAVGLPEDSPANTTEDLGKCFTCLCGQGEFARTHLVAFPDMVS